MKRTWSRWQVLTPVMALALASCGKKSDDSPSATPPTVNFQYFAATGKSVSIDMSASKKGDTFVIMPFILGDTNVQGATQAAAGTFTVSAPGAEVKANGLTKANLLAEDAPLSAQEIDHMRRVVLNRLTPSLGLDQTPGFWEIVDRLDAEEAKSQAPVSRLLGGSQSRLRDQLTETLSAPETLADATNLVHSHLHALVEQRQRTHLAEDSCPLVIGRPAPVAGKSTATEDIPEAKIKLDPQADYCIAYVGTPVTETNKDTIKASISTAIRRYKSIVYKGIAFQDFDDYKMKPTIVILPFDDTTVWPSLTAHPEYKIAGAFLRFASFDRPVIFMASDLSKVMGATDATKAKELWHSTIAHEMHHAFLDYFKTRYYSKGVDQPAKAELLGYDEGLAHYFEDLNGYNKYNFPTFTAEFLNTFFSDGGSQPFLWTDNFKDSKGVKQLDSVMRGAGHSMFHYLASRAGGVKFDNGEITESGGIAFLRTLLSSDGRGLGNLQKAVTASGVTTDWTTLMGQFIGALATDGSDTVTNDPTGKTQGKTEGVTNTIGETGQVAGFTFGNFDTVKDVKDRLVNARSAGSADKDPIELYHYQTNPIHYKVADPAQPAVINFGDAYKNAAVMVVKIKNGT